MGNTTWNAVRTLVLVVLAAVVTTSCPRPIDDELLLVVADEIEPTIAIDSPAAWSTYGYTVDVVGHLLDSSQEAGDGRGFVRTLEFDVSDNTPLDRTCHLRARRQLDRGTRGPHLRLRARDGRFRLHGERAEPHGNAPFHLHCYGSQRESGRYGAHRQRRGGHRAESSTLNAGCPTLYSSAVTTSITNALGHVDLTYLEPGTTRYKVVPQTAFPRAETLFTPDALGNFEFTFDPQDTPVVAGMLTVTVWATDTRDNTTEITHSIYDDPHKPAGTLHHSFRGDLRHHLGHISHVHGHGCHQRNGQDEIQERQPGVERPRLGCVRRRKPAMDTSGDGGDADRARAV